MGAKRAKVQHLLQLPLPREPASYTGYFSLCVLHLPYVWLPARAQPSSPHALTDLDLCLVVSMEHTRPGYLGATIGKSYNIFCIRGYTVRARIQPIMLQTSPVLDPNHMINVFRIYLIS
jgi:hypothetical protein